MNLFTKRVGLLLSAVVGVGAIAALSIGASFSLFSATSPGVSTTFTAGTIALDGQTASSCPVAGNLEPGDSGSCSFQVNYGGTLPAYIGAVATVTGVLAPELTLSINGAGQPSGNPTVIGSSTGNAFNGADGAGPYTATVDYTFSINADSSYQGQTGVVTVTFYAVQCSNNWAGGPAANEQCAGPGPANWATSASVLYNSRIDYSTYQYSLCYYCIQMGEFGNEISLANGGGALSDVVVDMANFDTTAGTMDITLDIYNPGSGGLPGSLIAQDEQSFSVPAAPNGGYGSQYCTTGDGASDPTCGIANFSITFNHWGNYAPVSLPGTVVYGIQYNDPSNSVDGGVNVQLSSESGPSQVSVGADTFNGYVFTSLASSAAGNGYDYGYNDVGPGEVTCSTVSTTFTQYSTATCNGGKQGLAPYVPAVEFDS